MSTGVLERSAAKTASHRVSPYWRKLLAKIPKFDVFRDAQGCWFDEDTANYVIDFVQTRLHYPDGDKMGEPIVLEDWQKAIFGAIFGFRRISDGFRRFRFVWFYIPRKNGKTAMMAMFALVMLFLAEEKGAQNILAGCDDEQAEYLLTIARGMIDQDDELAEKVEQYADRILCDGNILKITSTNRKAKHGKNVNFAAIDEVHEHRSADLSNALITSRGTRNQPLFIEATTADTERESYCNQRHEYAKAVRDGTVRAPEFLPIIYELEDPKRWKSEKAWKEVNPNYGVTIKPQNVKEDIARAEREPAFKYEVCRLYLNLKTKAENRWFDRDDWEACHGLRPGETPKEWRARALEALREARCWGGLDLGSTDDLTAFVLVFDGENMDAPGSIVLIPWFWCPEAQLADGKTNAALYRTWLDDGFLNVTEGNATDFAVVRRDIMDALEPFALEKLGMDMHYGAETCQYLQAHFGADNIVAVDQGFRCMTMPCQDLDVRVKSKTVIHGGNPVLSWNALNAWLKTLGNMKRPLKESENSPNKIDGIAATLDALSQYLVRTQADSGEIFFI